MFQKFSLGPFKIQGTRFDNCNTLYLCLKLDYSQREGGEGSKPSLFNFPGRGNRRGCIEGRESASRRICERVCEVEQMMLSGRLIWLITKLVPFIIRASGAPRHGRPRWGTIATRTLQLFLICSRNYYTALFLRVPNSLIQSLDRFFIEFDRYSLLIRRFNLSFFNLINLINLSLIGVINQRDDFYRYFL